MELASASSFPEPRKASDDSCHLPIGDLKRAGPITSATFDQASADFGNVRSDGGSKTSRPYRFRTPVCSRIDGFSLLKDWFDDKSTGVRPHVG
jgi:hypothetical protein